MMMVEKITLMELYLIETVRAKGLTDEMILQKIEAEDIESFQQYDERFDFTGLLTLHESGSLERILREGYEVTFLTFTGLVNILQLKFNKIENKDYVVKDYTISQLKLTDTDRKTIEQMLSPNWSLTNNDEIVTIFPVVTPKMKYLFR